MLAEYVWLDVKQVPHSHKGLGLFNEFVVTSPICDLDKRGHSQVPRSKTMTLTTKPTKVGWT